MNFDNAIFPEDNTTVEQAITNSLSGLTYIVENIPEFVNKGNKITIQVQPEDGFISVQLTTQENK